MDEKQRKHTPHEGAVAMHEGGEGWIWMLSCPSCTRGLLLFPLRGVTYMSNGPLAYG